MTKVDARLDLHRRSKLNAIHYKDFIHIHLHTKFSPLDGMGKLEELILRAKELGQTSMAVTDHGSTSGLWEAQKLGDKHGIHIIHGSEFYYERENDGKNGHLLILAKNDVGLRNMFKMQEIAYVDNFYYQPRINWDILKEHKEGLIVTSACLGSTFCQYIMNGEVQEATSWAQKFKEVFHDDFYIEIQPNSIPEQHLVNTTGVRIAKQLDIPIVASADVHYTLESDCFPHEVLLAMQFGAKMTDEKRFKLPSDDFWLKSGSEMYQTFEGLEDKDVIEALHNTSVIAEKCTARIKPGKFLPEYYDIPEGKTERDVLISKVKDGVRKRGLASNKEYIKDIQHEINVIDEEGYSGYFCIVQDYVTSAKERGEIVGDGRGSGAGSKVLYVTGTTEIDPAEYDLLFERFMSHGRTPDVDTDFSSQEAVYDDLVSKYGVDSVARIMAFGTMTPKSCIRKVLSTFGHPQHIVNMYGKMIPSTCVDIDEAISTIPDLKEFASKHEKEFNVIRRLQNIVSHESVHAGGFIIYPQLSNYLPVRSTTGERERRVVAWDMNMIEEVGFYKFDILALETLPVIKGTLDSIEKETGGVVNLHTIDYEDDNVYRMLRNGDVSGVFQISAQAQKVMEQSTRTFRDLIAINALIRPGVGDWNEYLERRNGKKWDIYEPRRAYMEETEGIITYQEQYLMDAHKLAGWGVAYADKNLRKNKDIRNDTALHEKFISDSVHNGYDEEQCEKVWSEIEEAVDGGYGFNKSHSASYAMTSYQTAYLKHHYPTHFYASLMNSEKSSTDGQSAISGYIAELKHRGINVLPPDVNKSHDDFIATPDGINYRLTAISHVSSKAINHINKLRPIESLEDLLERREKRHANKRVIVNLIKSGCFDFQDENRSRLIWQFEMSERTKTQIKEEYQLPKEEWNNVLKAKWEKEALGMYLTYHPMDEFAFKPIDEYPANGEALQGGEVIEIYDFKDKNGKEMAFITIDTNHGNVKAVAFQGIWAKEEVREHVVVGNIIMIKGRRSGNDILVNETEVLYSTNQIGGV